MFTDIELYKIDLKNYYKELSELDNLTDHEAEKKAIDAKFKDKVRKYLPTCLNVINSTFNCKFSIYKEGKGYNAALQLVDTKVKKTKEEVQAELLNYQSYVDTNSLQPDAKAKLDLAIDILNVYVDDLFYNTVYQNKYVQEALSLPDESNNEGSFESNSNAQPHVDLIPQSTEIQYNPYAGMPIYSDNNENLSNQNTISSDDSFKSNSYASDKDYAYSDVIDGSSISIFNSIPNNHNNNQ